MTPRGILKSPRVFPLEHELSGYDESRRTRSRSRDHNHADEASQLVVHGHHREHHTSSRKPRHGYSRHRSKSRPRRHVRWADPVAFIVSDGTDMFALRQLPHRRSSLPGILEDTREHFRESLRELERISSRSGDKDSNPRHQPDTVHPSVLSQSPSTPHRRPALKSALSSPDVGRTSQVVTSPKSAEPLLHASAPISHKHRRRRISLPNGIEAAVRSPSHALWLSHHAERSNKHSSRGHKHPLHSITPGATHVNNHNSSHAKGSDSISKSHTIPISHTQTHSAGHSYPVSRTPRHYDLSPLPSDAREQPSSLGPALSTSPPTLAGQQSSSAARPLSQITTSTYKSLKSSPEKGRSPSLLPASAMPFPASSSKPVEPQTPKSTRSGLLSFPTIDDVFSKDETSHSMMSVRRLFGLSAPKHEPRKLPGDNKPTKKYKHSKQPSKESHHQEPEPESYIVGPPPHEPLYGSRHSFDLGTFSFLGNTHMRWITATAHQILPVLTPAEIQASHLTLSLNPALMTIHWDIRHPPNAAWSVIPGRKTTLWTSHNEPATVPLVPYLRIISPYFPWVISAHNPAGVTCGDIFSATHSSARQLVWRGEFDQLRSADKSRLAAGYHANRPAEGAPKTADSPFDPGSWLVRADWLGRHTVLRGMSISKARDKHGAPVPDVLLSMYLAENRRGADSKALVITLR